MKTALLDCINENKNTTLENYRHQRINLTNNNAQTSSAGVHWQCLRKCHLSVNEAVVASSSLALDSVTFPQPVDGLGLGSL